MLLMTSLVLSSALVIGFQPVLPRAHVRMSIEKDEVVAMPTTASEAIPGKIDVSDAATSVARMLEEKLPGKSRYDSNLLLAFSSPPLTVSC